MNIKLYIAFTLILPSTSFGQAYLDFSYEKSDTLAGFKQINMSLIKSNSDTIFYLRPNLYEKFSSKYKITKGNYNFILSYEAENYKTQQFIHPLTLNGNENRVELKISIKQEEKKSGNDSLDSLIGKSYINLQKIYNNLENVFLIPVNNLNIGDAVDFKIVNHTPDPIFAYYLPSLFYGELHRKIDDQYEFITVGTIDLNVGNVGDPLMPQDTTFAFVPDLYNKKGGISYLLKILGDYRFKVYYSLEEISLGYSFYQIIDKIEYWLQDNTLFEINYDFIVK